MTPKQKITPFLWFDGQAEQAMNHYVAIFKNSKVGDVSRSGDTVMSCTFELDGQRFMALNGGPMFKFTEAISMFVSCETQAEVDELWAKLSAGGAESRCGWLKDKFGLSWQIIPKQLGEMLGDKDRARSSRVMQAMMQMGKIDIAGLERAYAGGNLERADTGNTSARPRGKFVWYDLMTTDPKAAQAFYGSVIGWDAKDSGMPDQCYTLLSVGSTMVAGLMPIPDDARKAGVQPAWMGYIGVDDVDSCAERVEAAGGAIHRQPNDIPGVGRFAVAADPHGAGFMLFTPQSLQPPPRLPPETPGQVVWHELHAGDLDRDFAFYSGLFDWTKSELVPSPAGPYQTFATGAAAIGGMMTKLPQSPGPMWLFYFSVSALDAALRKVEAGGGAVLHGPMQIPTGGWIATCSDPQGAMFALLSCAR